MLDIDKELTKAIRHFWRTRANQKFRQGSAGGRKDAGNRSAVTGGKHADGFVQMIRAILRDAGLVDVAIEKRARTLPGYFRERQCGLAWTVQPACRRAFHPQFCDFAVRSRDGLRTNRQIGWRRHFAPTSGRKP